VQRARIKKILVKIQKSKMKNQSLARRRKRQIRKLKKQNKIRKLWKSRG
jgi:hypothetical protein